MLPESLVDSNRRQGVLPKSRRFDATEVEKVRSSTIYYRNAGNQQQIVLEGERVITVAKGVRPDRLRFMLMALRQMRRRAKAGSQDAQSAGRVAPINRVGGRVAPPNGGSWQS